MKITEKHAQSLEDVLASARYFSEKGYDECVTYADLKRVADILGMLRELLKMLKGAK